PPVEHAPVRHASSPPPHFSPAFSTRCRRAPRQWTKRLCASATPAGVLQRRGGTPVATPARLHREQPCRFAPTQDRDALATLTHPIARSLALRADDLLPTQSRFLRVRRSADLHALRPLQSCQKPPSRDYRNRPA